jgi:DNA mismatch endonuclease (patch repair protein)
MVDIVSKQKRSEMMSGIRGSNTGIEVQLRHRLHGLGFRYRLHVASLPGKPDLVFPRFNAVVFVNGCFWHAHTCELFRLPKTRTEFWRKKLEGNRQRDLATRQQLAEANWRVLTVWECATRSGSLTPDALAEEVGEWLYGAERQSSIPPP